MLNTSLGSQNFVIVQLDILKRDGGVHTIPYHINNLETVQLFKCAPNDCCARMNINWSFCTSDMTVYMLGPIFPQIVINKCTDLRSGDCWSTWGWFQAGYPSFG